MFKRITISILCVAGLGMSGCASLMSQGTGTAPVGTEEGERSLGQMFIDSSIVRTAKINLYKLDSRFKQSRVNIESFHGHVLLTGQVPDQHLRTLAEGNVQAMSDVKAVHNYITVGDQIGYSTIMNDTMATANTRALLMKAPVLSSGKVKVHTEDGVMYIMGKLNTAEINDLNNTLQSVGSVNKIIMLIDNVEQISSNLNIGSSSAITTALVQTPLAIDLESVDPANAQ